MKKTVEVNRTQFIKAYLNFLDGSFKFKPTEVVLLVKILDEYITMSREGLNPTMVNKVIFSSINDYRKEIGWSSQMLSNIKKDLENRKIIVNNTIAPWIIPQEEIHLIFKVDYGTK